MANGRSSGMAAMALCLVMGTGQVAEAQGRPGASAKIPDGQYACQMWIGNSYVSLAGKLVGGSASVNALTKTGAKITAVKPAPGGITIEYTTARGYRESMDCKRA